MEGPDATRMPVVQITHGEAMADSRDVAAYFGKEHYRVLQTIRELHCSDDFRRHNFVAFKIKDLAGESTSHVTMTKDGFTFLAMGFTGPKAATFKEFYIAQFNLMEAELRNRHRPAVDPAKLLNDPAALRVLLAGYTEKVIALEAQNAVLKEDSNALDRIAKSDGSLCLTDAAKTLELRPREFIRFLSAKLWIYRRAGGNHWIAYQPRIQAGDLEMKVTTVDRPDGTKRVVEQTRVTPQGLTKLAKLFSVLERAA